jgi:CDP-glucose 4,6-dehydratase
MAVTPDFWRGRRVFLTGHTGFKGAWLSLWLQQMGAEVTGYSLAPDSHPNLFEDAAVAGGMDSVISDIRDAAALTSALRASGAEVVFHMAAQSLVRESYRSPIETLDINVMGTAHLLQAVREAPGVRAVVNVTSDKCYSPHADGRAHVEGDPLGGEDPYSASKGCAEIVTAAYRRSFFAGEKAPLVASVRAGNVIGGGDWSEDRLIPDIIRAYYAAAHLRIRNPQAVRPWQHVLDPLCGYLMLAQALLGGKGGGFADGWNFGPNSGDARPVSWVVESMERLSGWTLPVDFETAAVPENPYLRLDSCRARAELGWRPALELAEALAWVIDWYEAYRRDAGKARAKTLEQITRYCALDTVRGNEAVGP